MTISDSLYFPSSLVKPEPMARGNGEVALDFPDFSARKDIFQMGYDVSNSVTKTDKAASGRIIGASEVGKNRN